MELLLPDKAIAALEEYVITPYRMLHPTLGVIIKKNDQNNPDYVYLRSIQKKAEEYGAKVEVVHVSGYADAANAIQHLRHCTLINGIIILSSFGAEADRALSNMVPSRLDIDCTAASTFGQLITSTSPVGYRYGPCAAVAVMKLLEYENIDLTGKNVAVMGRSLTVGRPLAEMLTQHNATVTCYHSKSEYYDLSHYDIVVSAMGKAKAISHKNVARYMVQDEFTPQYLIDVGINVDENGKVCGDFDFESFKEDENIRITPVPGCIGKLATVVLFSKLFSNAAEMNGDHNA